MADMTPPSQTPPSPFTPADGNAVLAEHFAPWVRDLGLDVTDVRPNEATLRLPWSDRLAREGGALSGQALMAAADTATVIAVCATRGGYGPMTTVQQSTTFQRPIVGVDVYVTARLTKLGRTLAFADITMTAAGASERAAHATAVYAILS
jgi:uncharacterized protein (TIGR00369 family)